MMTMNLNLMIIMVMMMNMIMMMMVIPTRSCSYRIFTSISVKRSETRTSTSIVEQPAVHTQFLAAFKKNSNKFSREVVDKSSRKSLALVK